MDSTKIQKLSYDQFPRKYKAKVVNFCPYCRGVLWSIISLPFVYLWRKLPHKPKEEKDHEEIMKGMKRRGILIRSIGGGIQFPIALYNYMYGDSLMWVANIFLGFALIGTFAFLPGNKYAKKYLLPIAKVAWWPFSKIYDIIAKKLSERKPKEPKPKVHKNPSIVKEFIHSKHDIICPPVCFIEKVDQDNLR